MTGFAHTALLLHKSAPIRQIWQRLHDTDWQKVRRRDMLRLTGVATVGAMVGMSAASPDSRELFASIAAGDQQPLAQLQTTHATDLALGRLAAADRPALWRLARWADDGDSDILRVNATDVLAKTGDLQKGNQGGPQDSPESVKRLLRLGGGARGRTLNQRIKKARSAVTCA